MAQVTKNQIYFFAGGTAGHIIPASVLYHNFLEHGYKATFFTDARGEKTVQSMGITPVVLPITRPKKISFIFTALCSVLKILTHKPKATLMFAFGGYPASVSVVAFLLRVPLYVHEQNRIIGNTNKIVGIFARKIFTAFPDTQQVPKKLQSKLVYTGTPVRLGLSSVSTKSRKIIVVLGGSLGAVSLGTTVAKGIIQAQHKLGNPLTVYHQVPISMVDTLTHLYKDNLHIYTHIRPYFENVPKLLSQASVLIARAGGSTVFEAIHSGTHTLFIPYPSAKSDHQTANAQWAEKYYGAVVLPEKYLTPSTLNDIIFLMLTRPYTEQISLPNACAVIRHIVQQG